MELSIIPTSHWERLAAAMRKPFPELKFLYMWVEGDTVMSLPDSFLGGSAPLLQFLLLRNCPFPGILKLLLSAINLVSLSLWKISDSGYVSAQALVTAMSVMSRLETLCVQFQSPLYPPSRHPPPLTRSVLPSLTKLVFEGVHEYLEDLLAQIEAPLLNHLKIAFFMDLNFVVPQLHQLISHAEWFKRCDRASVYAYNHAIQFAIFREAPHSPDLSLEIMCRDLDRQLSSLAQVCNSSLSLLPTLVQLDIVDPVAPNPQLHWTDNIETTPWLDLLGPFTAVKDLRLSDQVGRHVCQALEELAEERVTEVLPKLQNIFLRDPELFESVPKFIEKFIAARQLSGHPVAVHFW
ncbi:hypothetical protein F5148DRAFT_429779 [Russula earlei]|uniref:Uncharacterized protein n=1 Tax=Russula earlei TaxID=71964 RepID=A0ACC0TZ73_9AGAM|nr:hypothetical protein F5148DRAFT_429779 [Russula earlei]